MCSVAAVAERPNVFNTKTTMRPVILKTNHQLNPFGIDSPQPSFSWQLGEDTGRFQQSAFELRVQTEFGVVWESGVVAESRSHAIRYAGETFESQTPILLDGARSRLGRKLVRLE